MTEIEVLQKIADLNIGKYTSVLLTFIENGNEVTYNGRFEFNNIGTPAIKNERIGIRIIKIKGSPDIPYEGGLLLENLIDFK